MPAVFFTDVKTVTMEVVVGGVPVSFCNPLDGLGGFFRPGVVVADVRVAYEP